MLAASKLRYCTAAVLIFSLATITSVALAADEGAWNLRVWWPNETLPNTVIAGIAQTRDGYLWVGSVSGLARFDGVSFEQFPLSNLCGGDSSRVGALASTRDGALLVAMYRGPLLRLNFGRAPEIIQHLPDIRPTCVLEDTDGAIWLGSHEGIVCRVHNNQVAQFSTSDGLLDAGADCWLTADTKGRIWFCQGAHVGVFHDGRFGVVKTFSDAAQVTFAREGGVWVASDFKLYHCDAPDHCEERGNYKPDHASGGAQVLLEDRAGAVWIGTSDNGLFRYDGSGLERVPTSRQRITNLLEDVEGNMWVGTQGGGLNRVQPRAVSLETAATGLSTYDTVLSICEDRRGTLWASMQDGSLKCRRGGEWASPAAGIDCPHDGVMCVVADQERLWFGTSNHRLYRLENEQLNSWTAADGLAGAKTSAMLPAKNGDLWLAEQDPDVLQRFRNGEFKSFQLTLESDHLRALTEDSTGDIWIASEAGRLWRATGDDIRDETAVLPPATGRILCLYAAADGALWIGTERSGLVRLANGTAAIVSSRNGLYDDYIAQIAADDKGCMWFGSSKGIFKVRSRELLDITEGKDIRIRSMRYGPLLQATVARSNAMRSKDGHLWMIMGTALTYVSPENVKEQSQPPPVILEKVSIDDQAIASYGGVLPNAAGLDLAKPTTVFEVPPDYHHLEIDFTAPSFYNPAGVQFQYQLQGFEDRWIDGGSQRHASFSHLPPGDYRFTVKACNNDGKWNQTGAALAFTVVPPVWQTSWFRVVATLLFTSAIVAVARYISFRRLRKQLRALERQTAVDRERTRIARDLHDELGAGLTNVAILGDMALRHREDNQKVGEYAQRIACIARQVMHSLDETVWAVHPRNDTLEHLINYLGEYSMEFLDSADIRCRVNFLEDAPQIAVTAEVRHNVLLVVKEAINNVVRHAHATEVRMHVTTNGKSTSFSIEDNGSGFQLGPQDALADGLRNMRQRMEDIGGHFDIETRPGQGTRIFLSIPSRCV